MKIKLFPSLERKSVSEKIVHISVSVIFMAVALSYLYLLVWAVIAACKTHTEIALEPFGLPETWNWKNFLAIPELLKVNRNTFWDMLFNSAYFCILCALLTQFCSLTFAYALSKYTFPGSKWIYLVILVTISLPIYGNAGATYKLYHDLGLINSYAQIIPSYNGFNMFALYYYAYFTNLSWTYAEAAKVDGANDFQIYFKIMLPQAKPIFGALFLTQWINLWNSYESHLVYLSEKPTLSVGIYQFNKEMIYNARLDILFAACVVVMIPALVLFVVFNKAITTNVSVGGIKG